MAAQCDRAGAAGTRRSPAPAEPVRERRQFIDHYSVYRKTKTGRDWWEHWHTSVDELMLARLPATLPALPSMLS